MNDIEPLFKTAIDEIERVLSSKTVVGEPITQGNNTIIPLVSVGFGFGAGSGGETEKNGKGASGGGTGGGGGVKPVAVLIIDEDGVRLEQVKSATTSVIEKVADTVGKVMSRSDAKIETE